MRFSNPDDPTGKASQTARAVVPRGLFDFCNNHPALLLFLAALLLRLAFIWFYGVTVPPVPWGDDQTYDKIAHTLVVRHEYHNTWYPPGYPLFLAVLYLFRDQSWLLVRIVQALLGAATCVLLHRLGRQLFSDRVGMMAAGLLAFYPGHVFFTWRLMGETLYIFLIVLSLWQAHRLVENPRPTPSLGLGMSLGFAQLVKSNLYPLPILLLVWFLVSARAPLRRRLLCAGALVTGLILMWGIIPLANRLSPAGRAVTLPGNTGITLWQSNNPLADGYFVGAEATPAGAAFIEQHGYTERLRQADAFEKDRLYRDLAFIWIRENPQRFAALCLQKLNNAFGLFPRAQVFDRDARARTVHLVTYGLLAPLALIGLVLSWRAWRIYLLLHLVLASFGLMVILFYGTPRFTLLIIPVLLLFASQGLIMLLATIRPLCCSGNKGSIDLHHQDVPPNPE